MEIKEEIINTSKTNTTPYTGNLSKLKNKKKDIISAEKAEEKIIPAVNNTNNKKDADTLTHKDEQNNLKEQENSIEGNEGNNSLLNKITFKIQLLFSMTNKLHEKLISIFSKIITVEHLKVILEERDCRGVCGYFKCGTKLNKKDKKYYYNSTKKEFTKESLSDYFCCSECVQNFIEIYRICEGFDYFRLLNLENIYLLSVINEYDPKNKYLDEISALAKSIISNDNKYKGREDIFKQFRENLDVYFGEEAEE